MTDQPIKPIIEAAFFVADKPLAIDHLLELFAEHEQPERSTIRAILRELREDYAERGIELVQVASGYRFQTKPHLTPWLKRLQGERSARYSRALLETVAIIAYRQPITRSEIENIRGISVSTDLIKRLQDFNWIRVLAHRNTPGRPALYGTTRAFLDYFNLKNLQELPTLIELRELVSGPTDTFDSDHSETQEKASDAEVLESEGNEINRTTPEVPESEAKDITQTITNVLDSENNPIYEVSDSENNSISEVSESENVLASENHPIYHVPHSAAKDTNGNIERLASENQKNNVVVTEVPESKDDNNNRVTDLLESEDTQVNTSAEELNSENKQMYTTADLFDSKK